MKKDALKALMEELSQSSEETQEALRELLEEHYGPKSVPLVLRLLQRRPDMLAPQVLSVLGRNRVLEPKVAELVALAAATALRCEPCLKTHLDFALKAGATEEESFEAILVASSIVESASHAIAFRVFQQSAQERRAHKMNTGSHSTPA